jgi:hypothetical protein
MGLAYSDPLSLWALISLEWGTATCVCFSAFGFEKEESIVGLWELVEEEEVIVVEMDGWKILRLRAEEGGGATRGPLFSSLFFFSFFAIGGGRTTPKGQTKNLKNILLY